MNHLGNMLSATGKIAVGLVLLAAFILVATFF